MPRESTAPSVGAPDPARLQAAIELVVARLQPDQIILFGSAARERMSEDSDLDLLVIKEPEPGRPTTDHEHWKCEETGDAVDVILMDRTTAESGRRSASWIQGAALEEGRTVYARAGVQPVPTGPTYSWNGHGMAKNTLFEPDHAHEFVERAERKWRLANRDETHVIDKCEMLQACMERALKALITAQGRRVEHTHDLNQLWEQAERYGERIDASPDRDELENLSRYAGDWQYDTPRHADPERTWAALKAAGRDLLDHARRRVPRLVRETTTRLAQSRKAPLAGK